MIFRILLLACIIRYLEASLQDKYCGKENCYHILGIKQDSTTQEIRAAYRNLAKQYHPDKTQSRGEEDTTYMFSKINHAYEILMNDELRKSYDSFLDNPDKGEAYHYYSYYKAVYMPQSNPFVVVGLTLLFFSGIQYAAKKSMYSNALKYISQTDKFKRDVNNALDEQPDKTKEEIVQELLKNVKIHGGYADPKLKDIIIFKILLLPFNIVKFFIFQIRWIYRYNIKKLEYTDSDKEYLTRKILGIKEAYWETMTDEEKEDFLVQELWVPENYQQYIQNQKEEQERKKAEFLQTAKGKRYQRYLKKNR